MSSIDASDEIVSDEDFRELISKIETQTRFRGRFYKDSCLRRRLAIRMRARGAGSLAGYSRLLDSDPGEYEFLVDALTINVTKFFRDSETWNAIRRDVIPHLFDLPVAERRIWSAGCASGEEAYSTSILLREWAEESGRMSDVGHFHIVGTDIDRRSLDAAHRAEYTELSLSETPEAVRQRWFSPGPMFQLKPEAKRHVSFLRHDLISELSEREQSLILCRNVIIYFDREIQLELFHRFFDSLIPGGFLVLGKVETLLGPMRCLFHPVNSRERIFRKPVR